MRIITCLCCLSLLLFSACTKNIDIENIEAPDYEPQFALPLLDLETPVSDILEDANPNSYSVDLNNLVTFFDEFLDTERMDTFDLNLSDIGDAIKSMEYKLVLENGIPAEGTVQLYFLDGNQQLLDSLLSSEQQQILPANTDENGNVTTANFQEFYIPFDSLEVEQLKRTEQIAVSSIFDVTTNNLDVYTFQDLKLRLGAKVIFNIE